MKYRDYIGAEYKVYIGIMENRMETIGTLGIM